MHLVACCGLKGGIGKTTVALNLAAALATPGRRVLVIDADEQGAAHAWGVKGHLPGVAVVALPIEGISPQGAERWARDVRQQDADLVVVDLPPHAATATQAALLLCDLAVVPCTPSSLDLRAAAHAVELIRSARSHRPGGRPRALVVGNRIDTRTASGRELLPALATLGEPVGPGLGDRAAFVDAATVGESVLTYAPSSRAAAEVRALAAVVERALL